MTRQNMLKSLIPVTAVLSILMISHYNYAYHGTIVRGDIRIGDLDRKYELYRPGGYSPGRNLPLVIVLHGANASGSIIRSYSGFNDLAEQKKFMVAYPDAYGPCWNDGRVDMESTAFTFGIDDVRFISQLIDQIVSAHPVDRNRVYVAGFSNGGKMALRLGIAIPEKLAAVATVSGLMPKQLAQFSLRKPVPVLIMHGTSDRTVPWTGGILKSGERNRGEVMSFVDTAFFWARNNGCRAPAELLVMPDADPTDGTLPFQVTYTCCNPGSEVLLVAIQGGNHSWPGIEHFLTEKKVGKTCRDINATRYIWDFFSRHKRS